MYSNSKKTNFDDPQHWLWVLFSSTSTWLCRVWRWRWPEMKYSPLFITSAKNEESHLRLICDIWKSLALMKKKRLGASDWIPDKTSGKYSTNGNHDIVRETGCANKILWSKKMIQHKSYFLTSKHKSVCVPWQINIGQVIPFLVYPKKSIPNSFRAFSHIFSISRFSGTLLQWLWEETFQDCAHITIPDPLS